MMWILLSACGPQAKLGMVGSYARLKYSSVPTISIEDARDLDGAVFVDVRTTEERSVSRIPGAVDAEDVLADPSAFEDAVLVAYCTVGMRSGGWAAERRSEGLDVRNLKGSILGWTWAGLPLEGPDGETNRVHTWSADYAWVPGGYEATQEPPVP